MSEVSRADVTAILDQLSEPFDESEIKCKPQAVKGERAMAIHFIDARLVAERLDEVVGMNHWQDRYETLADGNVLCKLLVRIGGEWIEKQDVGSPSEQPDGGDRGKAAHSDALKRAGVKYGIARYLYRLPMSWVAYDPQTKRFKERPKLPAWALPKPKATAPRPVPPTPAVPAAAPEAVPIDVDPRHAKGVAVVRTLILKKATASKTAPAWEERELLKLLNVNASRLEDLNVELLQTAFRAVDQSMTVKK